MNEKFVQGQRRARINSLLFLVLGGCRFSHAFLATGAPRVVSRTDFVTKFIHARLDGVQPLRLLQDHNSRRTGTLEYVVENDAGRMKLRKSTHLRGLGMDLRYLDLGKLDLWVGARGGMVSIGARGEEGRSSRSSKGLQFSSRSSSSALKIS